MDKLKTVHFSIALVVFMVTIMVMPTRSIQPIDLSNCDEQFASGTSCVSAEIPLRSLPLVLVLTSSQDLLAPEATSDINRSILVAALISVGYYLVATKPNNLKRKKKNKSSVT